MDSWVEGGERRIGNERNECHHLTGVMASASFGTSLTMKRTSPGVSEARGRTDCQWQMECQVSHGGLL